MPKSKKGRNAKKNYEISKDIVGGFLGNYKLLEETVGKTETTTVSLHEFQIKGFDQKAFFGSVKDDAQNAWYLVKDFGFRIFCKSPENKLFLTLKKIPK